MGKYPLSEYPTEIYNFEYKEDVKTETTYDKVQEYQRLLADTSEGVQTAIDNAKNYLAENTDLQRVIISALDINKLGDAIKAIQYYYETDVRLTLQQLLNNVQVWDETVQYYQADVVTYRPTVDTTYAYICTTRDTPIGTDPENSDYWTKITIKGESGLGFTMRYDYLENDQYNVNDCVLYNGCVWGCVKDCSNIAPDSPENADNEYWVMITSLTAEDIPMGKEDPTSIKDYIDDLAKKIHDDTLLESHPVGSYYWSSDSTDPSELFGGTWERVKDRFLYAAGDTTGAVGSTGGQASVTLTEAQMPSHNHGKTVYTNTTKNLEAAVEHICAQSEIKISDDASGSISVKRSGNETFSNKSIYNPGTKKTHYRVERYNNGVVGFGVKQVTVGGKYKNAFDSFYIDFNHNHNISIASNGGGQAHTNLPPYLVAYCWRRIS